jgi:hypothetical protein
VLRVREVGRARCAEVSQITEARAAASGPADDHHGHDEDTHPTFEVPHE